MKKIINLAGAALVMLASASCEKKETVKEAQSSVEKTDMVFTATSGNGALKTTILSDGTTAVWSSTDNLKVFTAADTQGSVCGYKSGAGTATAEFAGQCAKKGPWAAICPAIEGSTYSAGTITFTMPENQTYAANTFADGAMPCVAYSETNTFNFKHSFGILKLSLKLMEGKTGSVQSITVTDNGGKQLWGTFTVNPQTSQAATYSTGGASSVILDCGTGVALSESTATDFWIVAPAGAFASGFEVLITSTDGMEATLSTEKANTITAGEANEMPVQLVEFVVPRPACQEALDADDNWVTIGTQKWLKVNTKCIEYDTKSEAYNATWLTDNTIPISSSTVYTPYYTNPTTTTIPDYLKDQSDKLGMLYNWAAAVGLENGQSQTTAFTGNRQGICPNGSHVPSVEEWNTLRDYLDGASVAGKKMKTSTGWQSSSAKGEGDNGFAALPAGYASGSSVTNVGRRAYYWSSDVYNSNCAYYRYLLYNNDILYEGNVYKYYAYSVRCLKNN